MIKITTYQRLHSHEICVNCVRKSKPGTIFVQNVIYKNNAKARRKHCRECKQKIVKEKVGKTEKVPNKTQSKTKDVKTVEIVITAIPEKSETKPCKESTRSIREETMKDNKPRATITKEIPESTKAVPINFTRSILKPERTKPEGIKPIMSKPLSNTMETYTLPESDTDTEEKNKPFKKRKHSATQETPESESTFAIMNKKIAEAMRAYMAPETDDAPVLETTLTDQEITQEIASAMTEDISLEILEDAINAIEVIPLTPEEEDQLWEGIDELLHSL